jgi:hypothetical protein
MATIVTLPAWLVVRILQVISSESFSSPEIGPRETEEIVDLMNAALYAADHPPASD